MRAASSGSSQRARDRGAARAVRRDRLSRRSARAVAKRRRAAHRPRPLRRARSSGACSRTIVRRSCCIRPQGPETFSYTLSEAWHAGLPALVPPIGALAERVADSGAGWVMTNDEWHDDDKMLDRMLALLSPQAADARGIAAAKARSVSHASPRTMANATLMNYAKGIAQGPTAYVASRVFQSSESAMRSAIGLDTAGGSGARPAEAPATGRSSGCGSALRSARSRCAARRWVACSIG